MTNRLTDARSRDIRFVGQSTFSLKGADKRVWLSRCATIFQQFNLVPRLDVVSNVLHGPLHRRATLATMFNLGGGPMPAMIAMALHIVGVLDKLVSEPLEDFRKLAIEAFPGKHGG